MKLPILVARKEGQKICPNDYKIGWLMKDDIQGFWITWGSCKDLETALKCARDVIDKKGKREVYLSSIPLSENLTLNQIVNLEDITKSFN